MMCIIPFLCPSAPAAIPPRPIRHMAFFKGIYNSLPATTGLSVPEYGSQAREVRFHDAPCFLKHAQALIPQEAPMLPVMKVQLIYTNLCPQEHLRIIVCKFRVAHGMAGMT